MGASRPSDHEPSSQSHSPGEAVGSLPRGSAPAPMVILDVRSTGPLPPLPENPLPVAAPAVLRTETAGAPTSGRFWLEGGALLCACPDCGAPMAVRLWLLLADCWRCGTSIELTEEQEREALRLLEQARDSNQPAPAAPVARVPQAPIQPAVPPPGLAVPPAVLGPAQRTPASHVTARLRSKAANRSVTAWIEGLFRDLPAWLVSLVFHLILLTLLGLLTFDRPAEGPAITLAFEVRKDVREGGAVDMPAPTEDAQYDLPVPEFLDLKREAHRRALLAADQDARELRLVDPENPHLAKIEAVKNAIRKAAGPRSTLAVRDPRVRVEMVRREGGTTLTEAAVARGLAWLARHQNADGSWGLHDFFRAGNCSCSGRSSIRSHAAGTSLALLPFLGAGQTHLSGLYRDQVAQGLRWMVEHQEADGDLRGSRDEVPGMYAQGQGAIVLCEAFLMTGDEALRVPAQKAIDFIVHAQYDDGGWRYRPADELRGRPESDMSVVGWQLMALQSAQAAGLRVPEDTLDLAGQFLDRVAYDDGAAYNYMRDRQPSPAMSAEGLLCRIYLGWKRNTPGLARGVELLQQQHPPEMHTPDIYYWYYGTQTMHHFGGQPWNDWNLALRDILVALQATRGHEAGSWEPRGPTGDRGGRVYMTSLAICCLEVYYRHLPIFRQIDLK